MQPRQRNIEGKVAACCASWGYLCFAAVILIGWVAAITQCSPWFAFMFLMVATVLCGFMGAMYVEMVRQLWKDD